MPPLAFVAGLVMILNPCVLPLVPILVASALGKSRAGPIALAGGLVTSFTLFGFTVIAFGYSLGINEQAVSLLAGALLAISGIVLLIPRTQAALVAVAAPMANFGNRRLEKLSGNGAGGQYAVGLLLGVVWAPCVGPTLGVAIAAASRGEDLLGSFLIFLIFGLGVATSALAFAYSSRKAIGERRRTMQAIAAYGKPLFAIALLVVGAMVITGLDKAIEIALLDALPPEVITFTTGF
ncbi:cytochrome c biogenesis CcdA family protein [Erythrobacter sp. THAF29]|uniref:cytochrome c biogenesis CcdA family protein n=1 Tax=Erythrobacter sp. THAF29 TaxID=2587851 RepID=UPI0012AA83E1|nr:cytochrome c biogenesis CcdA family protein [Erythrobacter sp. THAF29]QFT78443.1 thiol:disulfide interchange protein precursor [Erythrobacter sp. THAF29]